MTAALMLDQHRPVADLLARGDQVEAMQHQARAVGGCEHPIRLVGHADRLDRVTGEVERVWSTEALPDGVQHIACKNRRASRCEPCSKLYQDDAFHLIAAGLRGGKGVPDTVDTHPAVFATFTAPTFGPVHTQRTRKGKPAPCRPHAREGLCDHGVPMACWIKHTDADPLLGQALCHDCYDYAGAVLWNASASELWRRTLIATYRQLARLRGVTEKSVRSQVRIQYVKVAEYQRRGLVHFHVLLRLDHAPAPTGWWPHGVPWAAPYRHTAPPAGYTADQLTAALRAAAAAAAVTAPHPARSRSVEQHQLDPVTVGDDQADAPLTLTLDVEPDPTTCPAPPTLGVEAGQGPAGGAGRAATLDARPSPDDEQEGPPSGPLPSQALDPPHPHPPHGLLPRVMLTPRTEHAVWGEQLDVRTVIAADVDTAATTRRIGRGQVAGYLAKYATKHTEALGPLDRRLHVQDLDLLAVNPHIHRLVLTAWQLAPHHRPAKNDNRRDPKLDRWAHQLGYGGHFLTKSRRYSTTFTALRAARAAWQHRHTLTAAIQADPWERLAAAATHQIQACWQMAGTGWRLAGDALLARTARNHARAAREAAREARPVLELARTLAA